MPYYITPPLPPQVQEQHKMYPPIASESSRYTRHSMFSAVALLCVFSMASVLSFSSVLSAASMTSIASIASINSVASIGSTNSVLSIGCTNEWLKNCWSDDDQEPPLELPPPLESIWETGCRIPRSGELVLHSHNSTYHTKDHTTHQVHNPDGSCTMTISYHHEPTDSKKYVTVHIPGHTNHTNTTTITRRQNGGRLGEAVSLLALVKAYSKAYSYVGTVISLMKQSKKRYRWDNSWEKSKIRGIWDEHKICIANLYKFFYTGNWTDTDVGGKAIRSCESILLNEDSSYGRRSSEIWWDIYLDPENHAKVKTLCSGCPQGEERCKARNGNITADLKRYSVTTADIARACSLPGKVLYAAEIAITAGAAIGACIFLPPFCILETALAVAFVDTIETLGAYFRRNTI